MTLVEKTVARINEEFAKQGNGATITLKSTGKQFNIYASEDNTYYITDQLNIWEDRTFDKRCKTVEDLAKTIIGLSK